MIFFIPGILGIVFLLRVYKRDIMLNTFNTIAVILIVVWIISYMLYNVGSGAHALLPITAMFLLFGHHANHKRV